MTEIIYEGKKVRAIDIQRLGDNLIQFKLTLEDGKVVHIGYFKEEI